MDKIVKCFKCGIEDKVSNMCGISFRGNLKFECINKKSCENNKLPGESKDDKHIKKTKDLIEKFGKLPKEDQLEKMFGIKYFTLLEMPIKFRDGCIHYKSKNGKVYSWFRNKHWKRGWNIEEMLKSDDEVENYNCFCNNGKLISKKDRIFGCKNCEKELLILKHKHMKPDIGTISDLHFKRCIDEYFINDYQHSKNNICHWCFLISSKYRNEYASNLYGNKIDDDFIKKIRDLIEEKKIYFLNKDSSLVYRCNGLMKYKDGILISL